MRPGHPRPQRPSAACPTGSGRPAHGSPRPKIKKDVIIFVIVVVGVTICFIVFVVVVIAL